MWAAVVGPADSAEATNAAFLASLSQTCWRYIASLPATAGSSNARTWLEFT